MTSVPFSCSTRDGPCDLRLSAMPSYLPDQRSDSWAFVAPSLTLHVAVPSPRFSCWLGTRAAAFFYRRASLVRPSRAWDRLRGSPYSRGMLVETNLLPLSSFAWCSLLPSRLDSSTPARSFRRLLRDIGATDVVSVRPCGFAPLRRFLPKPDCGLVASRSRTGFVTLLRCRPAVDAREEQAPRSRSAVTAHPFP